ncbi:uncharacterized protein LOC125676574 isoform X2 [Ostrea edulis]|uniref:uncharacterized protein LOC125676574 isoform X2 n=1 Tax=Ostrea edulis TaxID=37623 RepID=UPI0024AF573A|nr:uncharacterized protein LOC125676574 isoform X2 [Ostrea edulis]
MAFYATLFSALFYFAQGTTDNITSSTDESIVHSTITRGNTSTIPTEAVTIPSDFPVTTSKTTISTTNINTDTSAEGVTFLSEFPVRTSRTTITKTNINTDTLGKSRMTDCRLPGVLYRGYRNITESGRSCQTWQTQTPHAHNYDIFRPAQENYCRNFDREEPWCFTNDSNVRWELCGVEVCDTPCLNQSYYNKDITTKCLSDTSTSAEYCNNVTHEYIHESTMTSHYMWSLVKCLKNRVENSSGVQCPQIQLKSIALRFRNTIEILTRKSISECIVSPCVERLTFVDGMAKIITPCYQRFLVDFSTLETLCRVAQQVIHCAISLVINETNSTCVAEDKYDLAKKLVPLMPPEIVANVSLCISDFLSEFPEPVKNITLFVVNPVTDQPPTTYPDQIVIILSVGLVLAFIVIVFIGVGSFKIRAKHLQKTARRLPSIPKKREHSYEFKLYYPEESNYFDPDYQTVEEINDGYQHLIGNINDIEDGSDEKSDDTGSYVQPNDVHVVATITDEDGDDQHHSYLQIIECSEKSLFTNNECTTFTELASTKCDNEMTTEQERKRASEVNNEVSDINQQETAPLTDDNNQKGHCENEIVTKENTATTLSTND